MVARWGGVSIGQPALREEARQCSMTLLGGALVATEMPSCSWCIGEHVCFSEMLPCCRCLQWFLFAMWPCSLQLWWLKRNRDTALLQDALLGMFPPESKVARRPFSPLLKTTNEARLGSAWTSVQTGEKLCRLRSAFRWAIYRSDVQTCDQWWNRTNSPRPSLPDSRRHTDCFPECSVVLYEEAPTEKENSSVEWLPQFWDLGTVSLAWQCFKGPVK